MSDHKDRIEHTLEVLVYAPIGVGLYLRDMGPTFVNMFIARGRAEVDRRQAQVQQRTTTAKSIGQVAMTFGVPMVRQRVEREVDSARQRARVVPRDDQRQRHERRASAPDRDGTAAAPATGPEPAKAARRTARTARATDPGPTARRPTARRPAGDTLPIPGYDALSASQVVERLAGLRPRSSTRSAPTRARTATGARFSARSTRSPRRLGGGRAGRDHRGSRARRGPRSRIPGRAAQRNGAAPLWATREARPEPLADALAALLARDDATVLVGTLDDARRRLRHRGGRGAPRRFPPRGDRRDLRRARGARGRGGGAARGAAGRVLRGGGVHRGRRGRAARDRQAKNFFERAGFTARLLVMHKSART